MYVFQHIFERFDVLQSLKPKTTLKNRPSRRWLLFNSPMKGTTNY